MRRGVVLRTLKTPENCLEGRYRARITGVMQREEIPSMAIVDQGNIKRHLGDFCRKHGIRKLALFGSAVRGELQADSDIDVLVEFHPDQIVGLGILDMETELSQLLGGAPGRYRQREVPESPTARPDPAKRQSALCRRMILSWSDTCSIRPKRP